MQRDGRRSVAQRLAALPRPAVCAAACAARAAGRAGGLRRSARRRLASREGSGKPVALSSFRPPAAAMP
eukprot:2277634-Pleurochrysis_carterae.AAC.1